MSLIPEHTLPENLLPVWPVPMSSGQTEPRFRPASFNSRPLNVGRGDRVLHPQLGTGQVLHVTTRLDQTVTVAFQNGNSDVPGPSLRRIVPVTELARLIAATASQVTAWTVRKANG